MYENSPGQHEFDTAEVQVNLSDIQKSILHDYIHEVIDSYNVAELLHSFDKDQPTHQPESFLEGFEEHYDIYMVKGPLIGLFDPTEFEVSDVRYSPNSEDQDCPTFVLGPVHRESGKTIIAFQGLHFRKSEAYDAPDSLDHYYKAYAFIYDPGKPEQIYRCFVANTDDPDTEYENFDKLLVAVSDLLLAGGQI